MGRKRDSKRSEYVVVPEIEGPAKSTEALQILFRKAWFCLHYRCQRIFAIHGVGGVGKTTLLTQIKNKLLNLPEGLQALIWVVVSQDSNLETIQEVIGNQIGFSGEEWKSKGVNEKAQDIFSVLSRTKFVLLLDDLWETIELEKIGIPFPLLQNGSTIVFTTRFKYLCDSMFADKDFEVKPLLQEEAFEYFRNNIEEETFNSDESNFQLAQLLVRKCYGLPLALAITARALSGKRSPRAWYRALEAVNKSVSDIPGTEDELHSVLKLGYDNLTDDRVRSCLLYFALFPMNFKILKDDLIDFWIYDGLIRDGDDRASSQLVGYIIIETLVRACLLEEQNQFVKMHNLVRDMALHIGKKFQLTQMPEDGDWVGVRRISLMKNSIRDLTELPPSTHLLTLLLSHNPLNIITGDFFQPMEALTVLDLSYTSIEQVPQGISKLVSLQYLNLSHTCLEQLPVEMKMLVRLKYLNLEHNELLRMVPSQLISSLLALQVLRMFRCGFSLVEEMNNVLSNSNLLVEEVQCLNHLYGISITITNASALQKLPCCTRALSLECLWGLRSVDISSFADMKRLHTLEIHHTDHLQELNVDFESEKRFSSLRQVSVEKCLSLRDLTWLILAPDLEVLRVKSCDEMEEIIRDQRLSKTQEAEKGLNAFAKLQVLELENLPKLKSIFWNYLPFPLLKRVKVIDCPNLKKLPLTSSTVKGNGIVVLAQNHWWKDLKWQADSSKIILPRFVQMPD